MLETKERYFMKNKDWYIFDNNKNRLILTTKAPINPKITNSYKQYLKEMAILDKIANETHRSYNV